MTCIPMRIYGYDPLYIPAGLHAYGRRPGAEIRRRTRHIDSDYGRAGRQQQVLMAVRDKIMQPGQLAALLPRLPGLAMAMANTVQTTCPWRRPWRWPAPWGRWSRRSSARGD